MANINKIRLSGQTYDIQDPNAQPLLTAGQGITIENNVISATGGGGGITSGEVETMIEDYMSIDVNATLFTATISASSIYISNGEITNVWSQGYDTPRYISYTDEFRVAGDRSYNISALNLTQSFKDIYGNFDSSTVKGLGIIIKKSFYNKIPSQFKVNSGIFPLAKITSPITGMTNAWDVIPSLYNSYDWNNFNGDSWDDVKDDDYLLVWQNIGGTDYHLENYTWGYESRWGVGYTTDNNTWGTYVVMFTTTDYASETPNVPYICPLIDADTWQNLYTGVTYSQTSQKSYDGEDVDSISNTANSALTNANSAQTTANSAMSTANSALTIANSAMTIAQGSVTSSNLKTVNGTSLVQTGGGNIDVHGDWNENSSGSTSYIKNRPFYMEASSSSECALACVPLDDEEWNMSYGCVETYTIQTTRTFAEGEKLGLDFIYENQYNCEHPQVSPQTIVNNSGTLTVGPVNGWTLTSSDGVNWTVTQGGNTFCIQPIIFWNPTTITYHKLDSNFIDSDIARTSAVTESINAAVSGKVDTSSVVTAVTSASTDNEIPTAKAVYDAIPQGGGGKAVSGGTNISITTGETADTINCTLPITANTSVRNNDIAIGNDIIGVGDYRRIIIGNGNKNNYGNARTSESILIGTPSTNSSIYNVVNASNCIGIGGDGLEVGYDNISGYGSIAIGYGSKSIINKSLAIGYNTVASGTTKTNINNQLKIDTSNQVYIYNKDNTEMICLQDQLGGGGSSYTAGDGIDITNDVISVTGKVDTSAITTSVTSSSTDAQVPSAKAVYDIVGNIETLLSQI